jgi:hypothetical protein
VDKEHPNYYAIIPAEVRYDTELSANEKLLYGEISALSNKEGHCFASNAYFADLYKVDKRTIQRWLENLDRQGYVLIYVERDENNAVIKRYIVLATKLGTPHDKNVTTPGDKNVTYNNINNNNKPLRDINNTDVLFTSLPPKGAADAHQQDWEEFWTAFTPVKIDGRVVAKGSKKLAEKKYTQIVKRGVKHEDIMRGLQSYLRYCRDNAILSCGVAVFLNQERWKDEYGGPTVLAKTQTKDDLKQNEQMEIYRAFLERNQ